MTALEAAIAGDPGARAADEYQRTHQPVEGIDYRPAEAYAKEVYLHARQVFKNLDEKATVIINYLASGAGLFTLGSLAGVAAAKVPPLVVWLALPSMGCAVAAIVLATLARRPRPVFPPGNATQAAAVAEACVDEALAKKMAWALLAQWNLLTALLRRPIAAKGWYIERANWCLVAAVGLLLVPLITSLLVGPPAPPAP